MRVFSITVDLASVLNCQNQKWYQLTLAAEALLGAHSAVAPCQSIGVGCRSPVREATIRDGKLTIQTL